MSEQKLIPFHRSMTADKRHPDFAYLRQNVFPSREDGLYPSFDFYQENPSTLGASDTIVDIIGTDEDGFETKVIVNSGSDTKFYDLGSNSTGNSTAVGLSYDCGCFGNDGVHIALSDNNIYRVNHVNTNLSLLGTVASFSADLAVFDGLYYWWIGSKIFRQLGGAAPTLAFNSVGRTIRFAAPYNDQLVLFSEDGGSITALFWDKSDTDLFDKRIVIDNAKLIAAGVVDGKLMLIKGVGNSANPKERNGEIVVTIYDGESFVRVNSIKAGSRLTEYEAMTGVGIGNEVMCFSVTNNDDTHNTDLYQNFIYKVRNDGSIEVQQLPDSAHGDTHIVRIMYNYILYCQRGATGTADRIYINETTNDNYADYESYNTTTYITNFMNNPFNRHKLDGVAVVFEKLFEQTTVTPTGEQLDLYYRTSEREAFTLLGEITVEKVKDDVDQNFDPVEKAADYASDTLPLDTQIYQITKMPDGSALPEFNEIQFKFVSKRGFSVIQAWYYYSYITRNTLN